MDVRPRMLIEYELSAALAWQERSLWYSYRQSATTTAGGRTLVVVLPRRHSLHKSLSRCTKKLALSYTDDDDDAMPLLTNHHLHGVTEEGLLHQDSETAEEKMPSHAMGPIAQLNKP